MGVVYDQQLPQKLNDEQLSASGGLLTITTRSTFKIVPWTVTKSPHSNSSSTHSRQDDTFMAGPYLETRYSSSIDGCMDILPFIRTEQENKWARDKVVLATDHFIFARARKEEQQCMPHTSIYVSGQKDGVVSGFSLQY